MFTHQPLENVLRVSTCHGCHHHGVLSVFNVAPSTWSVEEQVGINTTTHLNTHWNFHKNAGFLQYEKWCFYLQDLLLEELHTATVNTEQMLV